MDVVGLAAFQGKLYSGVYQPENEIFGAMYIDSCGKVELKGPPLTSNENTWHIIPGFGMLIDNGAIVVKPSDNDTTFGQPNPRTAIGVDRAGKALWIVVVDGRQLDVSEGLTLTELASLFQSFGVWDALNFDGGGSSTLVLENNDCTHEIINTPVSDDIPGTARQVAVNLGIYLPGCCPRSAPRKNLSFRERSH